MKILHNISRLYPCDPLNDAKNASANKNAAIIENAAIVWEGDKILWVGASDKIPKSYHEAQKIDAKGKISTPGFIDAHTHLAFGGWRSAEFYEKLTGTSYLDIARRGGGIQSTVKATREATSGELLDRVRVFGQQAMRLGVTTIEAKSGYGLNLGDELKQLDVYKQFNKESPLDIIPTFLGAHTYPPEYAGKKSGYVDVLINEIIPAIKEQEAAVFFDIFVEETAFDMATARKLLSVASDHGFKLKLHVDQISSGGGAELAVEVGAISADHLEFISDDGIRALVGSKTIPVSLPIASLYLNQPALPARKMLDAGLPLAIATDFNPGSAPANNLHLAMWLGCVFQRMTPMEALRAVTIHAAMALDIHESHGSIAPGKKADFLLLDVESIEFWMYHYPANPVVKVYKNGVELLK